MNDDQLSNEIDKVMILTKSLGTEKMCRRGILDFKPEYEKSRFPPYPISVIYKF